MDFNFQTDPKKLEKLIQGDIWLNINGEPVKIHISYDLSGAIRIKYYKEGLKENERDGFLEALSRAWIKFQTGEVN